MNRRFLLTFSLLSSGLLAAAAGCGDDVDGSGGLGGGTTATGTGQTSTATGTTNTGSSSSMNTTSTGSMAATCEAYCAAIDANCSGGLQQYGSVDACMEICQSFTPGTAPDTSMDTLECRAYHTGAAMGTPDPHCMHAGPLGSGPDAGAGCTGDHATRCTAFCNAAFQVCDGDNVVWGTVAECEEQCADMPDTADYSTAETGGNTLACRMYHMTVAADAKATDDMQGFADHCLHIALASQPCGGL